MARGLGGRLLSVLRPSADGSRLERLLLRLLTKLGHKTNASGNNASTR